MANIFWTVISEKAIKVMTYQASQLNIKKISNA
jgi:hypothetical protein